MALITEDGTAKADAESYITVAAADTYFSNRGNTAWAALVTAAKESALRKATDYMAAEYSQLWAGARIGTTQALDWPRYYVPRKDVRGVIYYASNAVPAAVANACAELAVRASAGDLTADIGAQVVQETVGPISVSYAPGARQQTGYPAIEHMLSPFFKGGGAGSVPVVRA